MADARRRSFATTPLSAKFDDAWSKDLGGDLTQATIRDGLAYLVRKDQYRLLCLNMADGAVVWERSFAAGLDGPPTVVGDNLFIGSRDGSVHCLRAKDGERAWRYRAAPLERLTLDGDRLAGLWPVSSSVLYENGLIYAVAGRNSYLDGGIRLVALDPASGEVKHSAVLEGPWPDRESLKTAVVTERDRRNAKGKDSNVLKEVDEKISRQWATGYHVKGGEADLLVSDGADLYMAQSKFNAKLEQVPLERIWISGWTPMGKKHLLANFGLLNDTMFHRQSRAFDDHWPSYGSGPGSGARYGTLVVVGDDRTYAAQHFIGGRFGAQGGYATHQPGEGNRIVADGFETGNLPGGMMDKELRDKIRINVVGDKGISRTDAPIWQSDTPIVVRALLGAKDSQGHDLIFAAGIVEGKTVEEWDKSTYYEGPGKLQVFSGAEGKLLAEYELPACPVFDGLSAADGKLLIPMVNGQVTCFSLATNQ